MIIIRCEGIDISKEELRELHMMLVAQYNTGVILLPYYCDFIAEVENG